MTSRKMLARNARRGLVFASLLVVAAVSDARQLPQARLDAAADGRGGDGGRPLPTPLVRPVASGSGAEEFTPFQTLTQVRRVAAGAEAGNGMGREASQERLVRRQVAVRARTRIVHPSPRIRHATAPYPHAFPGRTAAEASIIVALDQPVERWEFDDSPLPDVALAVEDRCHVPVEIDFKSLEDAGINADAPVSGNVSGVSLRSALKRSLEALDLTFLVKDGVLLITTRDRAATDLVVGFYPTPAGVEGGEICDVIQSTIAPETWAAVGGPGVIMVLPMVNELVVSQAHEVHEAVTEFLAALDAELDEVPRATGGAALRAYPVRDPKVRDELQAKVVKFCNAALGQRGDPQARVHQLGNCLVVQAASRAFHVYAAEVIRSVNGVELVTGEVLDMGPGDAWAAGGFGAGIALADPLLDRGGYVYEHNADARSVSPLQVLGRSESRRASALPGDGHAEAGRGAEEVLENREVAIRSRTAIVHPQPRIGHALDGSAPRFLGRPGANKRIVEALKQPVGDWQFDDVPLRDVERAIEERSRIPVEIDSRSLEQAGVNADTPASVNASGVSLRSALERLLTPLDLACMVKDEVLLITTRERAAQDLQVVLYPAPAGVQRVEFVDVIQGTVAPETWADVGGSGAIRFLPQANEFVVSQTPEIHEAISGFLQRFEAVPGMAGPAPADTPAGPHVLLHAIRDPATLGPLERSLVPICNAALGRLADPEAKVYSLGGSLVVQSASRVFQVAAAEVIRSIDGVEVTTREVFEEAAKP